METSERWLPIPGYAGDYEVSDLGRVRSYKKGGVRVLKAARDGSGYSLLTLCHEGVRTSWLAHRLVMLAFVGPLPPGAQTRHLDGNPANNQLSNLAYGTGAENQADRARHGTDAKTLITHCPQGHPYDDANTIVEARGTRVCRTCKRGRDAQDYAANLDRKRQQNRDWKARNPDYQRAYRQAKREALSRSEGASSKM